MNDIVIPKNTRGSNMEEPLWFDPDESARTIFLLKKMPDEMHC